jgi:hypothetical protein
LKIVTIGYGVGRGGKVRRGGREGSKRPANTSNQVKRRGRERQTVKENLVSNCTHDMYSTPVDLSFSYLRSAVEASLDTKNVQMEANTTFKPSDNPAKKFRPLRNSLVLV